MIPGKTYYYKIITTDAAGNLVTDNNSGSYFTFVGVSAPTVLLVDAYDTIAEENNGATVIPDGSYTNILAAAGISYGFWKVNDRGYPQLSDLQPFPVVMMGIIAILATDSAMAQTAAKTTPKTTAKKAAKPAATTISKEPYLGAIVVDAASGKVLFEDHADAKGVPASVLKLMTFFPHLLNLLSLKSIRVDVVYNAPLPPGLDRKQLAVEMHAQVENVARERGYLKPQTVTPATLAEQRAGNSKQ